MAATIEWSVENLEYTNDSAQIVTQVDWMCSASEEVGGKKYLIDDAGAATLNETTTDADGFISYSDLTQEKCLEWLFSIISKERIEADLKGIIDNQVSPALASGKPWA